MPRPRAGSVSDYLDRVRKLSALLFVIGVGLVLATMHAPSVQPIARLPIYVLLVSALIAGGIVYIFPWRRFHPNLFLVVGAVANAMIALLIALSGGRDSIYFPLFVFVVVASGAYYTAVPLAIVTAMASLGSIAHFFYGPFSVESVARSAFEIGIYAVTAYLSNTIFRDLERSTATAQHNAATLDVLRRIALLMLSGARSDEMARGALAALGEIVPSEISAIGTTTGTDSIIWSTPDDRPAVALPDLSGDQLQRCLAAARHGAVSGPGSSIDDLIDLPNATWLLVGLLAAEAQVGVLLLARGAGQTWTSREREAVEQVGDQIALGLQQALLHEQAVRVEAQAAAIALREDFLARVGHDLRTPLTVIVARSDLLRSREVPPERVQQSGARIHAAAMELQSMISDLLDLAYFERRGWVLDRTETDLVELTREAAEAVVPPSESLKIEINTPPGPIEVIVDRPRMKQALVNLIGNAVKYSPRGGTVQVALIEGRDRVEIRVADQGVGIAPEAMAHLFEKFYRAPNQLARGIPGTGLGLSIVKQLIDAHGGWVRAESEGIGRGSTFIVCLPLG